MAENSSKYTEKASIFYHLFLPCLIFSYIIGAKSFSHYLPPMTRPILIPPFSLAPFPSLSCYFPHRCRHPRLYCRFSAQNAANSPHFRPLCCPVLGGDLPILHRLPFWATGVPRRCAKRNECPRRGGVHTKLLKSTDREDFWLVELCVRSLAPRPNVKKAKM